MEEDALYAHYNPKCDVIEIAKELECLIVSVRVDECITRKVCIAYRGNNIRFLRFPKFMESLLDFLGEVKADCFIFGDFNNKKDSKQLQYNKLFQADAFCVQNDFPRIVTSTSPTCMDHVINGFLIESKTSKTSERDDFGLEGSIPSRSYAEDHQTTNTKQYRSLEYTQC